MKNLYCWALCAALLASCAGTKTAGDAARTSATSLEGERVNVETVRMQGIAMAESLNDEGTEMIARPFKWYAGFGTADNRQVAVELAQREAYATISRVLDNAVQDRSQRGNVANNGRVQQALTSYWSQVSSSLQQGCEPFGEVTVEYSPATRLYHVTAKVAIRGDRFNKLLDSAGNYRPEGLSGTELEQFIEVNASIMEAAKGN